MSASRFRQRLAANAKKHQRQLEQLLAEAGPLIRGSFGTRARVCGADTCRCARGELHESKYLTASEAGVTRLVHVPAGDEVDVSAGAERYRRFWKLRSEWASLSREQLLLLEELGRALLKPYPPDAPIPPPGRRGRKPKGGGGTEV